MGGKKPYVAFEICEVLQRLREMNLPYAKYEIEGFTDLIDRYGNEQETRVVSATFSRETLYKINFENFLKRSILDLADEVYISPALQE
jgi:hypothetical protein